MDCVYKIDNNKDNSFIIEKRNNVIFIKKDNNSFTIDKSFDSDI
jgi:hypothetical protein